MPNTFIAILSAAAMSLIGDIGFAAQPPKTPHKPPVIGIKVVPVSSDLATLLNLNTVRGLMVIFVVSDSLAAHAGIARNDVIVSANGRETNTKDQFAAALRSAAAANRLVLRVWRAGSTSEAPIVYQTAGDQDDAAASAPAQTTE